ncbi:DUF3073 family protein [Actinomadura oligospora]|uniref:DUF3073 family protein n=1 Tax=Actinomadura oligospora TaxID=111804 RepID=UPI0004B05727|nr:DUF3073 family protein [Actinomadura oligospora]
MGRGRAKAKQAKVARKLKYTEHTTDLDRLSRELATPPVPAPAPRDDQDHAPEQANH